MAAFNVLSDTFQRPHFSVRNSAFDQRLDFFVCATRPKLRSAVVQIDGVRCLLRLCSGPNISDCGSLGKSTHDGFLSDRSPQPCQKLVTTSQLQFSLGSAAFLVCVIRCNFDLFGNDCCKLGRSHCVSL